MTFTTAGWAVVHSIWQGTLVAGATALLLSVVPGHRARTRYAIACIALALTIAGPIVTALTAVDLLGHATRQQIGPLVDDAVGMPVIVRWRSAIVQGAAAFWIAGVAIGLLFLAWEWRRVRALMRSDLRDAGAPVQRITADLCRRLGVKTPPRVCRSTRVLVPMVVGSRRPMILLPDASIDALGAPGLRVVLAHELAHVKRRDYAANFVQAAAGLLLFHHPAARWMSRQIRAEREYCCDDVAVEVGGVRVYAHALSAIEDSRDGFLAVAAASGTLLDRIQRIAGRPRPALTPVRGALALLVSVMLAGVVLALAMIVPPALPLDVKMRTRRPPPGGIVIPPEARLLPRSSTR
jgi:bla regulator protein blaR1